MPDSLVLKIHDAQPALVLDAGDGLTCLKELCYEGEFAMPDENGLPTRKFRVDDSDFARWERHFQDMSAAGLKIPVPTKHTDDTEANRGHLVGIRRGRDSKKRRAVFGVIRFRDAEAAKLRNSADVSVYVPPFVAGGNGKTWQRAIKHVALTDYPVIPGLDGFQTIAASMTLGFNPDQERSDDGKFGSGAGSSKGVKEAKEVATKAAKAMPTGSRVDGNTTSWDKQGGNAAEGKAVITKTRDKLRTLGFKVDDEAPFSETSGKGARGTLSHADGHVFKYNVSTAKSAANSTFSMSLRLNPDVLAASMTVSITDNGGGDPPPKDKTPPKGDKKMSLQSLCEKVGLPTADKSDEQLEADLLLFIKDLQNAKPAEEDEGFPVAASMVKIARKARDADIDALVGKHVTPAVAAKLKARFCAESALRLSLVGGPRAEQADETFDAVIDALKQMTLSLSTRERSSQQVVLADGSKKAPEKNALVQDAEERAAAAAK